MEKTRWWVVCDGPWRACCMSANIRHLSQCDKRTKLPSRANTQAHYSVLNTHTHRHTHEHTGHAKCSKAQRIDRCMRFRSRSANSRHFGRVQHYHTIVPIPRRGIFVSAGVYRSGIRWLFSTESACLCVYLLVCWCANTIISERLNTGRWNLGGTWTVHKDLGRVSISGTQPPACDPSVWQIEHFAQRRPK